MSEHEAKDTDVMDAEFSEADPAPGAELAVRTNPADLAVMPAMDVELALKRRKKINELVEGVMVEDQDYGVIPGTAKPTLLKPGAEKLASYFALTPKFVLLDSEQRWDKEDPLFFYRYECRLLREDRLVATGIGSCNSWEDRYRFRWVTRERVPDGVDPESLETRGGKISEYTFAVDEGKTDGKYGKPESYWQRFRDAIEDGSAKKIEKQAKSGKAYEAWEIDATYYRIENKDQFTQVNTYDKIAQKRAFIASILIAVNASEFFTQDIEDLPPESLSGELDETTKAPPWAGEDNESGAEPERPYSPTLLRDRIQRAAATYRQAINEGKGYALELTGRIDGIRGAVVGNIEKAWADNTATEKRHSFFAFIWGDDVTSIHDLTDAQVLAHKKHLDWSEDEGGDWEPDPMALKEIRMAVAQRMKDLGQDELPLNADNHDGEGMDMAGGPSAPREPVEDDDGIEYSREDYEAEQAAHDADVDDGQR